MSWTILVSSRFEKDLCRLPVKPRGRVEDFVYEKLPATENPLDFVEKLQGYRDFFKARFGDYRVGMRIVQNSKEIHLLRVLHRREIYRHFP